MGTYHQRQILCCSHFKIYIGKLAEVVPNSAKIGFVVSTKIHKRAVQRNRIKRVARETFRLIFKENPELSSVLNKYMSFVVVAKSSATGASNKELRDDILEAIKKIKA